RGLQSCLQMKGNARSVAWHAASERIYVAGQGPDLASLNGETLAIEGYLRCPMDDIQRLRVAGKAVVVLGRAGLWHITLTSGSAGIGEGHVGIPDVLDFSMDRARALLATWIGDNVLSVRPIDAQSPAGEFRTEAAVTSCSFAPHDNLLACGDSAGSLYVLRWRVGEPKEYSTMAGLASVG
ncbi:MAG TPA: hypothetical protein VJ801_09990, partial [Polyangia bacterium]|nr:hypothetical protein [Polyangia bacterium]